MAKVVRVEFSDGSQWDIPVEIVIESWVQYDKKLSNDDSNYKPEIENGKPDDDEIIDWAANAMKWWNIAHCAMRVTYPITPDYESEWRDAEMKVVDQ